MTKRPADDEPEPIDAEFEPASGPEPKRTRRTGGRPLRSRSATIQELVISSALAAVLGGTVAIIASNASSNAPTGTLAREIDSLVRGQGDLVARADQAAADVVALRSRLDAQGERLDQQNATEAALRNDLTTLTSQLSAISGAGDGAATADSSAAKSPLGILLGRINRLEGIVADDKTAPETTREVQRAIADLSSQVAALDLANNTLVTAFDRREAALAALESGMQAMSADITALRGGKPLPARSLGVAEVAAAPPPLLAATARSQAIRALSALEAAARGNMPFAREHQALATLLPNETDLINMADAARTGVPTVAQLRSDFAAAADRSIRVATTQSDDGWNWLRTAFIGVVDFEPSEVVATNSEIIRNARRQLDLGDVGGAIEAVTSVSGDAGAPLRTWQTQALKRATLDESLRELNARLLETAASSGTSG
jgi:hypothetical protein